MTAWRYQRGIGEERAALVDADGYILEARISPDTPRLLAGAILDARAKRLEAGRYAIVVADGHEAIIEPRPRDWTEGAMVRVEVVREALAEPGLVKRARVRPAPDAMPSPAPALLEQLHATGQQVRILAPDEDVFADGGDTDVRAEATGDAVGFDGGTLHVELTRAMTLIDVDGWLDADTLARRAAAAAARTIRRLGIVGSIGIDFPSVEKGARLAAAAAFDAHLPQPFERTAINGYGFMQVIRPRVRPSLIELFRADPIGWWARRALEQAERSGVVGASALHVAPPVSAVLAARPDWLETLGRRLGGAVTLRPDPLLANWGGYVAQA